MTRLQPAINITLVTWTQKDTTWTAGLQIQNDNAGILSNQTITMTYN
jgi:hypothetical protein